MTLLHPQIDAAQSGRHDDDNFTLHVAARGNAAVSSHLRAWGQAGGLHVAFGREGNAQHMLRAGWSRPEDGYVWTLGPNSTLILPQPDVPGPQELQIQLAPFAHKDRLPIQRISLEVNGVATGMLEIGEQVILSVALPASLLTAREAVELKFSTPDAARPIDVTGAGDDRRLGFSFRRLRMISARPATAPSLADLMLGFESLGENCEFGLVQRRCGAEPLGLLRFASAPLPKLLTALRARFAGMGEPDNLVVELSGNRQEFMVQDRVFGLNYHAWVKAGELAPAEIHAREVRRVPFLIRKLVEELTLGEKIFVYHGMNKLNLSEARALSAAVRLYGPGTVFWVELADAGHKPGSLAWAGEGLLKGYIDRFAPGEDAHNFALESWVNLCRDATLIARGERAAGIVYE